MAVEQPPNTFGLWAAVQAGAHWPLGDEDRMRELGRAWNDAGATFEHGGASMGVNVTSAWPDSAGGMFGSKVTAQQNTTIGAGQAMRRLGELATGYGDDLASAKTAISTMITKNIPLYGKLVTFLGAPDDQARQQFVARLTAAINTYLDQMAARISARGAGAATGPAPVLTSISPTDGANHTGGASIHLSGSILGQGYSGTATVAIVDGKPRLMLTGGDFRTSNPLPSVSATAGNFDSNATEPGQLTGPFDFVGGSASVGSQGTTIGDDVSYGQDDQGHNIVVNEPGAGVSVGLPGMPVEAHKGSSYTWDVTPW